MGDNIKLDLIEIGWEGVEWIKLAQGTNQWQGLVKHGSEPSGPVKGGECLD
jgi:hypothetical protein